MSDRDGARPSALWARLRFSIVGPLLADPPESGELGARLDELAARSWRHPTTGEAVRFGRSTIERWFYVARNEPKDPVHALERQLRKGAGTQPSISSALSSAIELSYRQHPRWSFKLHYDNLVALAENDDSLGEIPSYTTMCRFMKTRGLLRQKRRRRRHDGHDGEGFVPRERRSFEVAHVHGLWHLDFHECSRSVVTKKGERIKPQILGIIDDRSRLACHAQWYRTEDTESLVHGLSQAIQKRGLPRALLSDNGSAMLAAETTEGLERLSITHWTTLVATPEQNGKQESFWGQVEGRLIAMLEGVAELTLDELNEATQAWLELEYNQAKHSEIGESPIERFLRGPSVGRPSPSSEELRRAFRLEQQRAQRRSDGTVSVQGVRFEIPSRYRTIQRPTIRYARWDLSGVDLVDPISGRVLCALYPLDRERNASGRRAALEPVMTSEPIEPRPQAGMAPLLSKLMADYAATGLPPAYLPTETEETDDE
jgi:transposase InsO family protein